MDNDKIEIELDTATVANKCMLHIQEITDCLTQIYYSVNQMTVDTIMPLPTDSFPIKINTKTQKPTFEEQKQITLNWALTKAFEEFIYGLTKSLKDSYKILHLYSLSLEPKYSKPREYFEKEFQKIIKGLEDTHFPQFIKITEKILNCKLPFREEILSLNQIRNCLVHRHGIVSDKDIKRSSTRDLRLKWCSLKFFTKINDHEVEITYDYRKDGATLPNLLIKRINNEKIFKVGDKISIDINEFNGIFYTCIEFVQGLFNMMPKQVE